MAKASLSENVTLSGERFYRSVTAYDRYSEFVTGCRSAKILLTTDRGATVEYGVALMKDISYTLRHAHTEGTGRWGMTWELVSSGFLEKNAGRWEITSRGENSCHVEYDVDIEFKLPVPGFLLKKLIASSLPKMFKEFETFASKL